MTPTARRFCAFLLGFFALTLNKHLNLGMDTSALTIVSAFVGGYIGQSTTKELLKKKEAPHGVPSV